MVAAKGKQSARELFFLYLMLAGAARFMVEFLRVNPRVFMGLSEAQLIAIVMMTLGTSLYLRNVIRSGRDKEPSGEAQTRILTS